MSVDPETGIALPEPNLMAERKRWGVRLMNGDIVEVCAFAPDHVTVHGLPGRLTETEARRVSGALLAAAAASVWAGWPLRDAAAPEED